jgi:hypothetical protein
MSGENRLLIEYDGPPDSNRDGAIDEVAERLGLESGDTGYSLSDKVRDHSIGAGEDRFVAYSLAREFRRSLPWARVRIWPEDDA